LTEKLTKRELSSESAKLGLVQIFTGDGKGKTTAALGTAIRASGQGLKICIIFFMKGDYPYGERNILRDMPGITVLSFGHETFVDPQNVQPYQVEEAEKAFMAARKELISGKYDLVILDEINVAVLFNLIKLDDVLKLIDDKPPNTELILTGRRADVKLVEKADLVTEMLKIKHPYDQGIPARKGIEY
jgi:cob(I)alamin adenosyltransferase